MSILCHLCVWFTHHPLDSAEKTAPLQLPRIILWIILWVILWIIAVDLSIRT